MQAMRLHLTWRFLAPSEVNFRITTPSVMTQYFEGFDRLLLRLVPITPYYAVFSHRKLVTTLDPIDATTKVQKVFDLLIRRQHMQLNLLDGAIDKAHVSFICFPNQLHRVYKFTRLVRYRMSSAYLRPFSSLSAFLQGSVQFIGVMTRRPSTFGTDRKCDQTCEAELHDRRLCFMQFKLSIIALCSRAPHDSVLAFLKNITRDFPDFQMVDVPDAESEFISSLIGAPLNRSFTNLVVLNADAHYYFNVSSSFQEFIDEKFNPEVWKPVLLTVLRQVQPGNTPKIYASALEPGKAAGAIHPIARSNESTTKMDRPLMLPALTECSFMQGLPDHTTRLSA
jgi:hypothetical protein